MACLTSSFGLFMAAGADSAVIAMRKWIQQFSPQIPTCEGPLPPVLSKEQVRQCSMLLMNSTRFRYHRGAFAVGVCPWPPGSRLPCVPCVPAVVNYEDSSALHPASICHLAACVFRCWTATRSTPSTAPIARRPSHGWTN